MKTILIADDQLAIRELVVVSLELENYRLLTAENGEQAFKIACFEHPDLILLDVKMPGSPLDGLEVCQMLKSDPATKDIYIIIVSASGQKLDMETGKKVGADDYLIKPFSPQILLEKVGKAFSENFRGAAR
jgi:CheY-like chemotaxis protein